MGNDPNFPFDILQSTGSGTKSLVVPALSSSFKWTPKEVAGRGDSTVYILCRKALKIEVKQYCGDIISNGIKLLFYLQSAVESGEVVYSDSGSENASGDEAKRKKTSENKTSNTPSVDEKHSSRASRHE